jgi:hypothetical protein
MLKKVTDFLFTKESLIIFILFLLFQPLRTQTYNLLYIITDTIFTQGDISEIYQYNYRGQLLGCEQALQMKTVQTEYNWLQISSIFLMKQLFSITVIILLFRKKIRSGFSFWLLVTLACFPILRALIDLQYMFMYGMKDSMGFVLGMALPTFLYIGVGFYIFFRVLSMKQRFQVTFIAFPAFVLSSLIWFRFLGPLILPVVT